MKLTIRRRPAAATAAAEEPTAGAAAPLTELVMKDSQPAMLTRN